MNPDVLTVRQWQENYRAGAYRSKDVDIQRAAGWWNWHCRDDALAGRLRLIAPVIMKLNEPFILDHYCVWFVNEGKWREAIYDSVRFEPLDGGPDDVKFFKVSATRRNRTNGRCIPNGSASTRRSSAAAMSTRW